MYENAMTQAPHPLTVYLLTDKLTVPERKTAADMAQVPSLIAFIESRKCRTIGELFKSG